MTRVNSSKLKTDTDEILERVRDSGEQFEVWRNGQIVAVIVPADIPGSQGGQGKGQDRPPTEPQPLSPDERARLEAMWAKRDELIARMRTKWPKGVSAVDAVREARRDL